MFGGWEAVSCLVYPPGAVAFIMISFLCLAFSPLTSLLLDYIEGFIISLLRYTSDWLTSVHYSVNPYNCFLLIRYNHKHFVFQVIGVLDVNRSKEKGYETIVKEDFCTEVRHESQKLPFLIVQSECILSLFIISSSFFLFFILFVIIFILILFFYKVI